MNIFYFFQEIETPMFQWQRIHFIDELQRHNCRITCFNPLKFVTPQEANERLIDHLAKNNYDLFFTNVCYEKVLFPETLDYVSSKGLPTLCLRCDNLIIPYNDKKLAHKFDLVWLTSIETQHLYNRWGVKSFFLPYAANPYAFKPFLNNPSKRSICFIGTPYGSRSIMINTLTQSDIPVDVYYKKTNRPDNQNVKSELKSSLIYPSRASVLFHRMLFSQGRKVMLGIVYNKINGQVAIIDNEFLNRHESLSFEDMVKTYSESTLSMASSSAGHTDALKHPLKVINLRNFEIPMCGGIEICRYNAELADYFEEGKEIVFYRNREELIDKARYYTEKASDLEITNIKKQARKRAEEDHTWWNRFTKAFDLLGLSY